MLLVGRALVGIAGRYRNAIDTELRHRIEEGGDARGVGIIEEGTVDGNAEALGFGRLERLDRAIVDAWLADGLVVHLLIAVEVNRPGEIGARLVLIDLLLEQQRIRAHDRKFFARNDAFDDLRQIPVQQRLAARHDDHGRPALIDRGQRVLNGDAFVKNSVRIVDLAAAGASEVAPEQRLEHQHERIALAASEMLANDIGADSYNLSEGYAHERSLQNELTDGLIPKFRRQAEAYRLGRSVEDRHFRRPERGQGSNHVLNDHLRRRGASGHADNSGIAHPVRVDFAAVRDKVTRNPNLVADLAQTVGVGAVSSAHDNNDVGDLAQFAHGGLSILCRVANVAHIGTHDVAEATSERGDDAPRIVDAQCRLRDVGDGGVDRDGELLDVVFVFDQVYFAVDLPEGAFDFRRAVMADEHQHATPGNVPPPLVVHLRDQRASGVDGRQRPQPCVVFNFARDAMGAEDGDGAGRHVLQSLDETRAFGLERFDHVPIVDDLMAHVDRSAVFGQRPLDNIDRPNDAGAKPARLSQYDLHRSPSRRSLDG